MMDEWEQREASCEHVNITEEAGGLLHCQDCGETRQSILWPREIWSNEEES